MLRYVVLRQDYEFKHHIYMNYFTLCTCLLLIVISAKELHSILCYVCDNCPKITNSTKVQSNCRRCLINTTHPGTVKRSCVQSCPLVTWSAFRKQKMVCCKKDLCNSVDKQTHTNLFFVSALSVFVIAYSFISDKFCLKID
uniref:Uncharacterized protein n=1 Tax=Trichobilharzia regenti TaxID=157069 RepID=A0AA85JTC0_TRIRE|nr:unnamed protein product [Trichobilharzia regenti]